MKKHDIKYLKLLKKSLLLTNIVNVSNHIKSLSLSNQKCEIQPALINLRPNEWIQARIILLFICG